MAHFPNIITQTSILRGKGKILLFTESERRLARGFPALLKTVAASFLITLILMALLAFLVCFTPLPEEAVTPCVYVLNYISVFLSGLFSAAKGKRRGFLTGALAGGIYMMLLYVLGFLLFGGIEFTRGVAMQIVYCVLTGMAGGIVGINLAKR